MRSLFTVLLVRAAYGAGPVVISTWFADAVQAAYDVAAARMPALEAVDAGCSYCEVHMCDGTVGYGSHPDTAGEVTLDAIVMDGATLNVGAVAYLRDVRPAFAAARKVMHYSQHSLLAGTGASNFSTLLGLPAEGLETSASDASHAAWLGAMIGGVGAGGRVARRCAYGRGMTQVTAPRRGPSAVSPLRTTLHDTRCVVLA